MLLCLTVKWDQLVILSFITVPRLSSYTLLTMKAHYSRPDVAYTWPPQITPLPKCFQVNSNARLCLASSTVHRQAQQHPQPRFSCWDPPPLLSNPDLCRNIDMTYSLVVVEPKSTTTTDKVVMSMSLYISSWLRWQ